MGYNQRGHHESDTTEQLRHTGSKITNALKCVPDQWPPSVTRN